MKFIGRLCLLSVLFSFHGVVAQVDYDEIKASISDPGSSYYYPALSQRFIESDSTLDMEDFKMLYFGAVFQASYNLYDIQETEQMIRLANYQAEFLHTYQLADSLLRFYPMSVQSYFEKAYSCFNLKRFDEEDYNNKRYKILIKTILSSGDGSSFETAYHANLPNDEYETLKYLGLEFKEVAEIEYSGNSYDVFTLKPNKSKRKLLYFNISRQSRVD